MDISIIGMGQVGSTLGRLWSEAGHGITFGVRAPDRSTARELAAELGASVTSMQDAVDTSNTVLLAIPWNACGEVVPQLTGWSGKTLIDCTNPVSSDLKRLVVGTHPSAAEQIAHCAVDAHVVKAFNTYGAGRLARPVFGGQVGSMCFCGDHADSKATVSSLIADLGFDPLDAGPLDAAPLLESLALLWIRLAHEQGLGPDIGVRLLTEARTTLVP